MKSCEVTNKKRREQSSAEALIAAAQERPDSMAEILERAGNYFAEENLYIQVWEALSILTPAQRAEPTILFSLLDAANHTDNLPKACPEIKAFLQGNEAPDLRALYTLLCPGPAERLTEAEKAYAGQATPFTAFALGRVTATDNPARAEHLFQESLQLAGEQENLFATLRAVWALTVQLTFKGSYREVVKRSQWAIDLCQARNVTNSRIHLLLVTSLTYARILIGETAGLHERLATLETEFHDARTISLLRENLGDIYLALGEPESALIHYERSVRETHKSNLGFSALKRSRCLAQLGRDEEALEVAEQEYHLTRGTRSSGSSALALARLLAPTQPLKALPLAKEAFELSYEVDAPLLAQAGAWLARIKVSLGDSEGAQATLVASAPARAELAGTGLYFLECDNLPNFLPTTAHTGLELSLLGRQETYLNGERLELSTRQQEILVLLALHPDGLNSNELKFHLFGDAPPKSLKAILSRLRKFIPINSRPYRLEGALKADFIQLCELIGLGQLEEAVALYRGPLLRESESPRIREENDLLQEQLIQATLTSQDPELLYQLCQIEDQRLELWERLLEVLPPDDPRASECKARLLVLGT